MLSYEFYEIFKNIYFESVCEGLPLKSKIFTGVSFRKILGLYYKQNRQFFYYEGTSSYIPMKIAEHVNRVIFASENTPADKNMFKANNKGMLQERYSGVFI